MPILDLRSKASVSEPTDDSALDETPPGLDAIRAWIRKPRPWVRGVRLWLRWIRARFANAYRFLKKRAGPAAQRLRQLASEGERVGRAATRVGHTVSEMGGAIARGARALRGSDGKIGRASAKLGELGGAVRRFGGRLTEGGSAAAEVFTGVGRLTRALRGNGQTGLGLLDPPEEPRLERLQPPPSRLRNPTTPGASAVTPDDDGKHQPAPETAPQAPVRRPAPSGPPVGAGAVPAPAAPAASATPKKDHLKGLPNVFIPRVKALRERPRRDVLWPLIFDICGWREWTTPAELARWLSMHQPSLVKRHLRPMTKRGLLELRYPERRSSPRQAYRARRGDRSSRSLAAASDG